ncbi:amidohydrolase [Sandaracinus amylolyticus]|uniref:Exoenzymes regulatory protein AepA n=1 Tax=Sandaracinus amylolyticus TaxID=927083 RepID=A0A0F6YHR4_9BACT|nr:amidohydrolase [Sandaracinus amylolyticus]AKF04395.1 Exoenzymes regulatory protein AepA precursor [Sandaracinus amylolyticus]
MTDLVVHGAAITTLDPRRPTATALAVRDGRFFAVGDDAEIMALSEPHTRVIDGRKRRLIPGLVDSHIHVIRGGLHYNLELRWDGVRSLADAMAMLARQVEVTPAPQWVRVVGGFTEHQFVERRLPTLDELNRVAPETPVFILHLYDRALLNRAALRACGYTKDTPDPPGGQLERDARGEPTGLLLAKPNAYILYATLAKGPVLPPEQQIGSTRHFMRELNRLGVTSVIDAGGGFQSYPDDYAIVRELAARGELTLRIAYNLFTQRKGEELADFARWTKMVRPGDGDDTFRHNGAGEMLVFSAADFEDFREPRPELSPSMEPELEQVVRLLAEHRWPWRLHATYDETITRALDVLERVSRDVPFDGLHWMIDHAETISQRNIDRVAALGGGIAVQHRMMFQGEEFVRRYGAEAAERTPPIRAMLASGVPVGAGTDATRVASYNPWVVLSWLVTGRTLGGLSLYRQSNLVDRETALRLLTERNAWFSSEEGKKGRIEAGQLADFAILSDDYFAVADDRIAELESVLTVLGGRVVHGAGPFGALAPPPPPAAPDWSPVRTRASAAPRTTTRARCVAHPTPRRVSPPSVDDASAFWGALGCSCWAF